MPAGKRADCSLITRCTSAAVLSALASGCRKMPSARAEDAHLPYARHPAQRIIEIEQRVVAEKHGVVAAPGRGERDHLEKVAGGLAHRDAIADDFGRELVLRDGDAVLHFDLVDVLV